jgi:diguanylate cyclase (GGDEF)-like protein
MTSREPTPTLHPASPPPPRSPFAPMALARASVLRAGQGEYIEPRLKLSATQVGRNDGLKSGQVHTLVESTDGRIWMSGPCGLSCYDGSRVLSFDQASGLTTQGLRGLGVDAEGRIWVGSDAGLDVVERDGTIRAVSARPDWQFGPAKRIAFTPDGVMYVATSRGLISSADGRTFAPVERAELGNDVILDLAVDVSGRLVVASAHCGVSVLKNGTWSVVSPVLYQHVGTITRVATGAASELFIGGTAGLVRATTESDLLHAPCPLLCETAIGAICATNGDVWVASSNKVKRLREFDSGWSIDAEMVADASINDLRIDSIGNIWCATDAAGAFKISAMRDAIVQPDLGDIGQIFSIRPGHHGTLLIGAEHAVFRAKPGVSDEFMLVKHVVDARVWDVLEQANGTLWLATHAAGLLRVAPNGQADGQSERIGEHHPVLNAPGRTLTWFDGRLWAGTLRGLVSIAGDAIEELCEPDGASLGYVYTLLVDGDGVWICTLGNGLWHYAPASGKQGGLKRIDGAGLSATGNSYAIAKNEHGELVVLQDNRVVRVSVDAPSAVIATSAEPVAGWTAQFLSADILAVGSSDGIIEFNIRDGQIGRQIRCGGIGRAGWEFTSSRALITDYRNRLWCALNSGLTLVDLNRMNQAVSAPQVSLLDARWEHASPVQEGAHYVTPTGNWRVTFRGFAAWLVDETDVTYRHRLVGFEESFSPLKRDAEFVFSSLPAGTYLLEVQAHSPLTGFGPARQLATIEVTGPWWSSLGLDRAADALSAVKNLFSNRARNERLLAVNQELAQAVQARTREVANANLALNKANLKLADLLRTDALTEIANRRSLDETIAREWKRAVRDDAPLSVLMIDVDFFKAFNDRYGHARGDACLRLIAQCLARTGREGLDTCARYGGEEFVLVLPNTPQESARKIATRVCEAVLAMRIEHADSPPAGVITVSAGVATMAPHARESIAELMAKADTSLYSAKRRGRNQVGPADNGTAKP